MKIKKILKKLGFYLALISYLLPLAFPIVWLFFTSFKPFQEMQSVNQTLLPKAPTIQHYITAFSEQNLALSMFNSAKVGVLASVAVIIIAVPAAYALARYRTKINKGVIGWVLISQLFPSILVIVPLFLILRFFGLTNSHIGLIIVYTVWTLPFVLMMLYGYIKGIPVELEEAAAVDGATKLQALRMIVFPLLKPGIVATGIFAFISAWNEYFYALVLLRDSELMTLPINLARFTGFEGVARLGPLSAASLIATIPTLILFGILQKGLISGLASGAVKY
ncbi:MAG: carbohydrate ABC transporter permease [Halanaerobiales bacterium]